MAVVASVQSTDNGGEVRLKPREKTMEAPAWDNKLTLEFSNSVAAAEVVVTAFQIVSLPVTVNPLKYASEDTEACSVRNARVVPMVTCCEPSMTYAL